MQDPDSRRTGHMDRPFLDEGPRILKPRHLGEALAWEVPGMGGVLEDDLESRVVK